MQQEVPIQLCISDSPHMREEVTPVINDEESAFVKKPKRGTGLWTSTWREDIGSGWVYYESEYCDLTKKYWHRLTPRPNVNLYVIEAYADLERLIHSYLWETDQLKRMNAIYEQVSVEVPFRSRYSVPGLVLPTPPIFPTPRLYYLDFERLSRDYDGIWLTEEGWLDVRFDIYHEYNLDSWSCESILWFKWCFEKVETINSSKLPCLFSNS